MCRPGFFVFVIAHLWAKYLDISCFLCYTILSYILFFEKGIKIMNRLLLRTFENRGYDESFLKKIEQPSEDVYLDMDVLCNRLHEVHTSSKHLVLLTDFDTDGISCGVEGFAGFAELGFRVSLFMRDVRDGYEFSAKTIDALVKEYPTVDAILTADTGISCFEGVERAKALGISFFVTDHHKQQGVVPADVIVDPCRLDEVCVYKGVCGAYVLYQVMMVYAQKYCSAFCQEQIRRLRVFAGIGTVSDTMPLVSTNRQLVRDSVAISRLIFSDGDSGLVNCLVGCDVYRRAFHGLYTLYHALSEAGYLSSSHDITEDFYGYYLSPLLNSVKRMNGDLSRAYGVFFGVNPLADSNYLIELNQARKNAVTEYMKELQETDQPYAPYAYISSAPNGILGLLASRILSSQPDVPCVVLSFDGRHYSGSGRSVHGYPFCTRILSAGFFAAGHDEAFGVGFTDATELKAYCAFLEKDFSEHMSHVVVESVTPDFVISVDGSGDTGIDIMLFAEYLSELRGYRPFGKSFAPPFVKLVFHPSDGQWSLLGSLKEHLKIVLPYGFEVLCFKQGNQIDLQNCSSELVVYGHLDKNCFNGMHKIQFIGELCVE